MNSFARIALPAAVAALFAACSSTPIPPAPVSSATPVPTAAAPAARSATAPASTAPVAASTVATVTVPPHLDARSPISSERSVYFDYDLFTIKPEYTGLVERHGKYLVSNPKLAIKIEGHADERGSKEYNLALGQKRSEAVLRALKVYGVADSQAEATSWGEDKPRATGHDEAAWAQNRRADLQYPAR